MARKRLSIKTLARKRQNITIDLSLKTFFYHRVAQYATEQSNQQCVRKFTICSFSFRNVRKRFRKKKIVCVW